MIDLSELLEKNSDLGEARLKSVNVTLDKRALERLNHMVPNLNLSSFFREVIEASIMELIEQQQMHREYLLQCELDDIKKTVETGDKKTQEELRIDAPGTVAGGAAAQ